MPSSFLRPDSAAVGGFSMKMVDNFWKSSIIYHRVLWIFLSK